MKGLSRPTFALLVWHAVLAASVDGFDADSTTNYFGGVENKAYLAWVDGTKSTCDVSTYFAAQSSDPLQGAALHWTINDDHVQVAFAARAQGGWIGFGIAEAGGMKGSDIAYYESAHPDALRDAYATDKAKPEMDDCQDWTLVNVVNADGFLIVEAMRKLDTLDVNDYAITHDADLNIAAQRVVFAWSGDSDTIAFHGTNQARGGIRWYGEGDEVASFLRHMNVTADGSFRIGPNQYPIAANHTEYVNFCFSWSDFLDQGVPADGSISIVGAEMILDPVGGKFAHHAIIYGSIKPSNESYLCDLDFRDYNYPLYGWAPGTMPFIMPPDVGFTLGPGVDGDGIQSFRINMHYSNPELIQGATDSGGLRVYYVNRPLQYEMGIMPLADTFTHMLGTTLGNGLSEFTFDCSSDCSSFALYDGEPVTVVHEYFHMHLKGAGAVQQQIRNGQVIRQATTNYFDFEQSGFHGVRQEPFTVLPGDSFRTRCFYENADDTTVFGIESTDEMCQGFLLYYPAKRLIGGYPWGCAYDVPVEICNETVSYTLWPHSNVSTASFRTFGVESAVASAALLISDGIDFDEPMLPPVQRQQPQCLEKPPLNQGKGTLGAAPAVLAWAVTVSAILASVIF